MLTITPSDLGPDDVYDVLVREAGAHDTESARISFRTWWRFIETPAEYRFMGKLGFGGKLWWNPSRLSIRAPLYVNCYPKDADDVTRAVIGITNRALEALCVEALEGRASKR